MKNYRVHGYVDCTTIATGFLIVIYSSGKDFFFQEVSKDKKKIISFSPFAIEKFKSDAITLIESGPEKAIGDDVFFVFKHKNSVIYGSQGDEKFINQLNLLGQKINSSFTKERIKKINS